MQNPNLTFAQKPAAEEGVNKSTDTSSGTSGAAMVMTSPISSDPSVTPFFYTSLDGEVRREQSSSQVNDYVFDPASFARVEYPRTWPAGGTWPPQTIEDLCCAPGPRAGDCVGDTCYTDTSCAVPDCTHTFSAWQEATADWEQHFELRETADRGIGVFTKRAFKRKQVLGWYAGELTRDGATKYGPELVVGCIPRPLANQAPPSADQESETKSPAATVPLHTYETRDWLEEDVTTDASVVGNWTRFINHSCDAHADFRQRRVGALRISIVEAVRDVPAGVELTVNYGGSYFRSRTCLCGAANCVEEGKKAGRPVSLR